VENWGKGAHGREGEKSNSESKKSVRKRARILSETKTKNRDEKPIYYGWWGGETRHRSDQRGILSYQERKGKGGGHGSGKKKSRAK